MLLYNKFMENKTELRAKYKALRKTLNTTEKSKIITDKIALSEIFRQAKHVMIYYPTKYEVQILDLRNSKKEFYFPKVSGESLLVCPDNGEYIKSEYNILEPTSTPINPNILDLIIVPALAVDRNGYRLGYGGGYYDRFLAEYVNIPTLTPIFKESVINELPKCEYDIKINYIYTD